MKKGKGGMKESCSGTEMKNGWPWWAIAQMVVAWARLARYLQDLISESRKVKGKGVRSKVHRDEVGVQQS